MRTSLRPLLLATAALAAQPFLSAAPRERAPLAEPGFARNVGQANPLARFVSIGSGQPIFFTANDVRIVDTKRQRSLWLTFVDGASRDIDGEWSTGGHVTVLRKASAADESPVFREIVYRNVWRGIDARVSAAADGLKYSFEVSPGADPRAIHLRYSGADRIELTDAGELALNAGGAVIVDTRPVAYQNIDGRKVMVPVRFVQFDADVAFAVGKYDRTKTLVIDPTLVYQAYRGGGARGIPGADLPTTPGASALPRASR